MMSILMAFVGPCSVTPMLETTIQSQLSANVGVATISTLEKFEVDFKGTEAGLNSAFGTPVGMEAMEVLSDNEMRSYGWCYEVDGKGPTEFPDKIPMKTVKNNIRWFFAYAHYLNGEWISQCEPAYKIKPAFLCKR